MGASLQLSFMLRFESLMLCCGQTCFGTFCALLSDASGGFRGALEHAGG